MRNAAGRAARQRLQREGDPSTPGYGSEPAWPATGKQRSDIPVVPIRTATPRSSCAACAARTFRRPGRVGVVPLSRRPGPVHARVAVKDDRATKPFKPIYDTFGIVRGSEFPDELVIVGGHRDGWGPGAADNVSGTVSVLEARRARWPSS